MAPIRKGDGAAISPRGFQEVRKGDGTILWSAGSDIPDSEGDHFWPSDDGSGDHLADANGNENLSGSFAWQTGAGLGDVYPKFDGVDDLARSDVSNTVWGNQTLTVTGWVLPEGQDGGVQRPYAGATSSGVSWAFEFDRGSNRLSAIINDGASGSNITLGESNGPVVDSPQWHWVGLTADVESGDVIYYAASTTDAEITEIDSSSSYNDGGGFMGDTEAVGMGAEPSSATGDIHFEGGVDAAEYFAGEVRSQPQLNDWFNATKEFYE